MFKHCHPLRVYFADTDALGIVHHASYLRYMEIARTEFLRSVFNINLPNLLKNTGVQFAVRKLSIDYNSPAHLDDELDIMTYSKGWERASINFTQSVEKLKNGEKTIVCQARLQLVCIGTNLKPKPIPKTLSVEMCS